MYDMIIAHRKVSSKMDDIAFSVTTDAFHCDIFKPLHVNTTCGLLLKGTAGECNLMKKCHF